MNEQQYHDVCEICDRVLRASDTTIERVAIPWLHVIREHPVFLANYTDLFECEKTIRAVGRSWLRAFRNTASWLRQIARALSSDGELWFGPKELPERIDVLFVSHLLNASHAGQAADFYFGGLTDKLVTQGSTMVIALINHTNQSGAALAAMWEEKTVPRVVLSSSFAISEEIALHRRQKKESLRLRKNARKERSGLHRKVLVRASQEALSGGPRTALRLTKQIGTLVAQLNPKAIVVTHEGHAWERVAFAAARRAAPGTRCIGYQHAALFRLQHAIRRNLASEYNPDHILTAGSISKTQLERAPGLNRIPVSILGSNRTLKGATTNNECRMRPTRENKRDKFTCLVIPEGIDSECRILFEFSLTCARARPGIQFIWRLHPLLTREMLVAKYPSLRKLSNNIIFSQATLEEDIACCRWALYRGTTAVIQAVVAGLRPIYLQLPKEMSIDPLYELNEWRRKITTVSQFLDIVEEDVNSCSLDIAKVEAQRAAKKYSEDFFQPFDPKALCDIIESWNRVSAEEASSHLIIPW